MDPVNRTIVPSSPSDGEPLSEKEELSALKAGLRKVKIFKDYVGVGRAKKACREEDGSDGRFSARSDGCEYVFDSDSVDECRNCRQFSQMARNCLAVSSLLETFWKAFAESGDVFGRETCPTLDGKFFQDA
jgi:hypothetical protein